MNAGLITIHHTKNFGGSLQAVALQNVVKKRYSIDCKIINYCPHIITDLYSGFSVGKYARLVKNKQPGLIRIILSDIIHFNSNIKEESEFADYYRKYYELDNIKPLYTYEELCASDIKMDFLITGSDQVWNEYLFGGVEKAYFLKFGNMDATRVSYAASIGHDELPMEAQLKFRDLLNDYDYISVRENTAKSILQPYTNKEINVVLDPTFLLSKDEWAELFKLKKDFIKQKYIFIYTISWSDELIAFTEKLSELLNLPVVTTYAAKKFRNELKRFPGCTPDMFVQLVMNASYVVTNSFHGTAFSIIFQKQFWTFLNRDRNSRMVDLTTSLGLQSRIIKESDAPIVDEKIDYNDVTEMLGDLKKSSFAFLDNALAGEKNG